MRPRLASAAYARATHLRSTQCGCVTPRGTPFCSKFDDGARASLSSSPDTVEPPQAACGEPQQPCYEYRRPGLLSSSMIDLRSDARSRAEEKERARRALVSKHVGQSREGERDVPKRAAAILGDSLDRREPTVVVRAPTCVTACDQTCLRDSTFDAVNRQHQTRHRRLQGELAWRAEVQGRRRHLQIASAATSRDILMRTMALPLGTFLGDTQLATHHGEPKGFLKVVWCCGMYMQIFQCVSGSPYRHWQAMPAVARSSIETRLCRTLFFVELSRRTMRAATTYH